MSDEQGYDRLGTIPVEHLDLKPAAMQALASYGHYKTLADLEMASDLDLLAIPRFGPLAVRRVRQQIKNARVSKNTLREELMAWVDAHKVLVHALMAGEAVIVLREHISEQ